MVVPLPPIEGCVVEHRPDTQYANGEIRAFCSTHKQHIDVCVSYLYRERNALRKEAALLKTERDRLRRGLQMNTSIASACSDLTRPFRPHSVVDDLAEGEERERAHK